jgi:hypothetical protein
MMQQGVGKNWAVYRTQLAGTIPCVARWNLKLGRGLLLACLTAAVLSQCGCGRVSNLSMSASERFQLQAKCADEAREFESQWKKDNGTDFEILMFRRHYSIANGKCYSFVFFGNPGMTFQTVYDALSGKTKSPLVTVVNGADKQTNDSADNKKPQQTIRDYMEEDAP